MLVEDLGLRVGSVELMHIVSAILSVRSRLVYIHFEPRTIRKNENYAQILRLRQDQSMSVFKPWVAE